MALNSCRGYQPAKAALVIAAIVAFTGCTVTTTTDPTTVKLSETALSGVSPDPKVSLDFALAVLEEKIHFTGVNATYLVGKQLRQYFSGDADAPVSLHYVDSALTHTTNPMALVTPGTYVTYELSIKAKYPGGEMPIQVRGTGATGLNYDHATKRALDDATAQLLSKVATLTSSIPETEEPFIYTANTAKAEGDTLKKIDLSSIVPVEPLAVRGHPWGASRQQVVEQEGREPDHESTDLIVYEGEIGGLKANLVFQFRAGRLYRMAYMLSENHLQAAMSIRDFDTLDDLLRTKYGRPEKEGPIWIDRTGYDDLSLAFSVGRVIFQTVWVVQDTEIMHQLKSDNTMTPVHAIQYLDLTSKGTLEIEKRQATLEAL